MDRCSNATTSEVAVPITRLSSREFNQDTARAKKAARRGPVFITDRGRPAHVLMTIETYRRLLGDEGSIIDALGQPAGVEDAELEVPRLRDLVSPASLR
jgi:prevent-host-death family protein